ncbi:MAG: TerC family protein [Polyangiaceae bacterium]
MEIVASLVTLSFMEVVLGIDNIIFLAVLVARVPPARRPFVRRLGLGLALCTRLLLLFGLRFMMSLDAPLFHLRALGVPEAWLANPHVDGVSIRDLILVAGGIFLIAKSTTEIHEKLEVHDEQAEREGKGGASVVSVLIQIAVIDVVFSLDSVISALGMANQLWIMVTAMIVAVGVMLVFAGPISAFVEKHPTIKMLAMSFLLLIGVMLIAEGLGTHIPKGYIYAAISFSLGVELLNLRARKIEKVAESRRVGAGGADDAPSSDG